ncbi:2-oxo acid dehydrogenase subunit E2 [Aquirhabdus sp.]|uniref:2-oxo acid dehydrogenase subunit E2 n=1 Tax=Aquirhabdus sp. TaxID=2824160 RepID=UPI00396CCF15
MSANDQSYQVKTPDLGVEKAEVSEILVKVGDKVEKNQSLLVVESAKASVEVPSPADGVVEAILIKLGDMVQEGVALFTLSGSTATAAPVESRPAEEAKPAAPVADVKPTAEASSTPTSQSVEVPDLGVDQADISEILVKVGDVVTAGQSLVVVESAKASVEIPSPSAGTVESIAVTQGQTVKQGVALLVLSGSSGGGATKITQLSASDKDTQAPAIAIIEKAPAVETKAQAVSTAPQSAQSVTVNEDLSQNADVYAGPAVRQTARQLGVNLTKVKASGLNGRILKEDVYAYVKQRLTTAPAASAGGGIFTAASGLPPLPDLSKWGASHDEPLTRLQQAAIPQLSLNLYMPQVTQFDHADITELEALRIELKDGYKKAGIGLTILAFIAKATAHLLLQEPRFNSHLNDDNKSIKVREEIHLGIAVATDDGLIVPVLRNPDRLSIREIAKQLGELGQKARDKKLGPNDLSGATFTISSLGAMGGTGFTPLVNWPQVAILGLSPAAMQPIWDGQTFQPRLMLPLSLSYDHRVINGVDAARFARALAVLLGDLRRVLL